MTSGGASPILFEYMNANSSAHCLTWEAKKAIISAPVNIGDSIVSSWYGPGSYLAWLIAAYAAALSSIRASKCGSNSAESHELDVELLATLLYPAIAASDVVLRLIQCRLDPGINAATFVVVSSLVVLGPASSLSWQEDGFEKTFELRWLTRRQTAWLIALLLCHTVACAVVGEPYGQHELLITMYSLVFVILFYSNVMITRMFDKYPYKSVKYRPAGERMIVFCVAQLIFGIVLLTTRRSIWPLTGARLADLDQSATLFTALLILAYSRRKTFTSFFLRLTRRISGFSLAPTQDSSETNDLPTVTPGLSAASDPEAPTERTEVNADSEIRQRPHAIE
ncbi:hypothetical protein PRK78_003572 [Emydomyces testavorans]|uniref:Uncharacterized protein n=1 Tax=Emydomyces testavorans TaxID=2070801 RepID=A0AAF0IHS3_9EURO|nr:hypothetical protein PRK78_003572 [Emydomyces testavorans]